MAQTGAQNADVQRVAQAAFDAAEDIRINQQQVNAAGVRVGINRPDLQYTLNGVRYYYEWDRPPSPRAAGHKARILANDPAGRVELIELK